MNNRNIVNKEVNPNLFFPLISLDCQFIHCKQTPEQALEAIYQAQVRARRYSEDQQKWFVQRDGKDGLPEEESIASFFNNVSNQALATEG